MALVCDVLLGELPAIYKSLASGNTEKHLVMQYFLLIQARLIQSSTADL